MLKARIRSSVDLEAGLQWGFVRSGSVEMILRRSGR